MCATFNSINLGIAASAMNAVLFTSVLSAGNHALFAGTRILHSLAASKDADSAHGYAQAPGFLGWTTQRGVPYFALLATCSVSALCLSTSFIGQGQLWVWLQNLVGVSNQVSISPTTLMKGILIDKAHFRLHGCPLGSPVGDSEQHGLNKGVQWASFPSTRLGP